MLVFNSTGVGTYRRAFALGRQLSGMGNQVTILSTSPNRRLGMAARRQDGLTLVESPDLLSGPLRSGWDPWNTLNRVVWGSGKKFDVVHAFESRPTVIYPALFLRRTSQAALVVDWADWFGRGGSVEERTGKLTRSLLRPVETYFEDHFRPGADGVTVICSTLQAKAGTLGVPTDRILYLPNGSDIERFSPADKAHCRQMLNLPESDFVIGHVGALFPQDACLMAEAFDRVCEAHTDARLLVIGRCKIDLAALVRHPERIYKTGEIHEDSLNAYFGACDLFWLPLADTNANHGRLPLKLTDYMAAGKPVAATAVGDVQRILDHHAFGVVSRADAGHLAEKTIELILQPEQLRQMGIRARRAAEVDFQWSDRACELLEFYHRILQGQGKRGFIDRA
jgi:glycosyltransferase involved in cell wall biosynthesis